MSLLLRSDLGPDLRQDDGADGDGGEQELPGPAERWLFGSRAKPGKSVEYVCSTHRDGVSHLLRMRNFCLSTNIKHEKPRPGRLIHDRGYLCLYKERADG